jgi:hypothetical protein
VLAALTLAPEARAHRLEGDYEVLPGRRVRVEAWFETGDAPQGARVRVYRPDGKELFAGPGAMDAEGVYVFSYGKWETRSVGADSPAGPVGVSFASPERAETLKVVISAGGGHRKELTIPARELEASPPGLRVEAPPAAKKRSPAGLSPSPSPPNSNPADPEPVRPRERASEFPVKDLLLGVTFFLAAGAFGLSVRNARRLRDLTRG